jgi:hypothetical protein
MWMHALHFLPTRIKAVLMLPFSLCCLVISLLRLPWSIAAAIFIDETWILDALIPWLPVFVFGAAMMIGCTRGLTKRWHWGLLGLQLALLGLAMTAIYYFVPVEDQMMQGTPLVILPPEALPTMRLVELICGPVVLAAGLLMVLVQVLRDAEAAERAPRGGIP